MESSCLYIFLLLNICLYYGEGMPIQTTEGIQSKSLTLQPNHPERRGDITGFQSEPLTLLTNHPERGGDMTVTRKLQLLFGMLVASAIILTLVIITIGFFIWYSKEKKQESQHTSLEDSKLHSVVVHKEELPKEKSEVGENLLNKQKRGIIVTSTETQLSHGHAIPPKPTAYEEAMELVQAGEVACKTLRTKLLGCQNDQDFLAKVHCVRQAFQLLLQDEGNQQFFREVGKQMLTGLIVQADKNPTKFIESYEGMLHYALNQDTWPTTEKELEGCELVCMTFFDIVLDYMLMESFDELENPPTPVMAILHNHWMSVSFKETTLEKVCSVILKAKRKHLMVPDGFISHFYTVCQHVNPILIYGFFCSKDNLNEVCNFFKNEIVRYLQDIFDMEKVRYTSVQSLAEDIKHLSQTCSDIFTNYLRKDR